MAADDVAKLKEEIESLKKDLKDMSGTLKDIASSKAGEEKSKLLDNFSMDELQQKIDDLKSKGIEGVDTVEKTISENPFKSVAITLGAGFLAGLLLSKK